MRLYVKVVNNSLQGLYDDRAAQRNVREDVGFDCFQEEVVVPPRALGFPILLGIQAEPVDARGYMLVARSSITKTPLRLSNAVGIIDPGYRGEIQARVDNLSDEPFVVQHGVSLFQLVAGDLSLLDVVLVYQDLSTTARGDGGFGSTGRVAVNSHGFVADYMG